MTSLPIELNIQNWDNGTKKGRAQFMEFIISRYSLNGIDEIDLTKINNELAMSVCLILARITASLEKCLKHHASNELYVKCMCILLATSIGQQYALSSSNLLPILLKCLDGDSNSIDDIITTLLVLRKIAIYNDDLRLSLVRLNTMKSALLLMLHHHSSRPLLAAASTLLLDLASLESKIIPIEFSEVVKCLLLSPHVLPKNSAVQMITSILARHASVELNFDEWKEELINQLSRMLICSSLIYQYDTVECLTLLFYNNKYGVEITNICCSILCLRYTIGGSSLLTIKPTSDFRLVSATDEEKFISEIPEV
jgi:hypothetical protein